MSLSMTLLACGFVLTAWHGFLRAQDLDTSWKRGALTASQLLEEAMKQAGGETGACASFRRLLFQQAAKLKEMAEDVEAGKIPVCQGAGNLRAGR